MQLYLVTWKFESSEYQTFASEALIQYVEGGEADEKLEGYERIGGGQEHWYSLRRRCEGEVYAAAALATATLVP